MLSVLGAMAVVSYTYMKKRKAARASAVGKDLNKSAHSMASVASMGSVASMESMASMASMGPTASNVSNVSYGHQGVTFSQGAPAYPQYYQ